jgi:hypothetical protein
LVYFYFSQVQKLNRNIIHEIYAFQNTTYRIVQRSLYCWGHLKKLIQHAFLESTVLTTGRLKYHWADEAYVSPPMWTYLTVYGTAMKTSKTTLHIQYRQFLVTLVWKDPGNLKTASHVGRLSGDLCWWFTGITTAQSWAWIFLLAWPSSYNNFPGYLETVFLGVIKVCIIEALSIPFWPDSEAKSSVITLEDWEVGRVGSWLKFKNHPQTFMH